MLSLLPSSSWLQTWQDEGLEFLSVLDPVFLQPLHDIMQTPVSVRPDAGEPASPGVR